MKRYFYFLLLLLVTMLSLLSCKKDSPFVNPVRPTILQTIASDPELTLLEAAIVRTRLDTVFSSGGPFTIFCPIDSAFKAGGFTLDRINSYNPDSLSAFLRYHIITGKISSNDVVGFLTENVNTLDSGFSMYLTKNYYGIFVNGIQVIEGNIEAGDGVVQKIGSIDPPPMRTALQLINSLPELSYLAAVVAQLPGLQSLLDSFPLTAPSKLYGGVGAQGVPGFTLFAPTNTAFQASVYPTLSSINQADPNVLKTIFYGYLVNGFQFTCGFKAGWALNGAGAGSNFLELLGSTSNYAFARDGVTILVGFSDLYSGQTAQLSQPPRIIQPNIMCSNGVIQEIDQIFPPYYNP